MDTAQHDRSEGRLTAWSPGPGRRWRCPRRRSFTRVATVERDAAKSADPVGDDTGPAQAYLYPSEASWGRNRQLDIRRVTVAGAGGAMKLSLRMNSITTSWRPRNGFDHVAFTVFIELPGRSGGATVMPFQNARTARVACAGITACARTAGRMGCSPRRGCDRRPATARPQRRPRASKWMRRTTLSASSCRAARWGASSRCPASKVYVSTWDYDGGYRPLRPLPGGTGFGGGDGARDPLVMDDTAVITLP